MNDLAKNLILWVVIAIVLMTVFNNFGPTNSRSQSVNYSDFINEVQQGQVRQVEIEGHTVDGVRSDGTRFVVQTPPDDPKMLDDLLGNNVEVKVVEITEGGRRIRLAKKGVETEAPVRERRPAKRSNERGPQTSQPVSDAAHGFGMSLADKLKAALGQTDG